MIDSWIRPSNLVVLIAIACFSGWLVNATWAQAPDVQVDSDWPNFLGADRDGKSNETGIITDWSGGNLKIEWEQPVGRGYALGCVEGGRFFQFDARDETTRLICRNADDGKENWKFEYGFKYRDMFQFDSGPRATPLVNDGRVYIYGVAGQLHCLSAAEGDLIWKRDINREFGVVQNFFGVGSTPLVHDDQLMVMVGGSPKSSQELGARDLGRVESNGTAVVFLDKKTGKTLNQFGNDLASYSSIQIYEDGGKKCGVAWLRAKAIGFDLASGKELWSFPYRARKYESVNASTPVVDGAKIFLCESYGPGSVLLDVAGSEPKVVWQDTNPRRQSLATHWNTPILHDGHLYACHGEGPSNCELRCVEFDTGAVKWKQRGYGRCSLTYVDSHLVVLGERGGLHLIKADPNAFELVSSYQNDDGEGLGLSYPCWAAPIIANGRLYVRGKNRLVCLQLVPR